MLRYLIQNVTFNASGWGSTIGAVYINLSAWMLNLEVNKLLTVVISIMSIAFLAMKMYDQYLVTKARKKESHDSN